MAARVLMLAVLMALLAMTVRVYEESLAELAVYATMQAFYMKLLQQILSTLLHW